jgi:hypothetical protein
MTESRIIDWINQEVTLWNKQIKEQEKVLK